MTVLPLSFDLITADKNSCLDLSLPHLPHLNSFLHHWLILSSLCHFKTRLLCYNYIIVINAFISVQLFTKTQPLIGQERALFDIGSRNQEVAGGGPGACWEAETTPPINAEPGASWASPICHSLLCWP